MSKFIVLEALDAGGSQTQTNLLVRRLQQNRKKVVQFHFPQEDRATGRLIYDKFLLMKNKNRFSRREQALIYIQDFFSKTEEIKEALQKKQIVVSDRFCTSTMAYQTIGLTGRTRQQMLKWIIWLCFKGKPALPKPDFVLFIDTPVSISLQRLKGKKLDYFESKQKLTAIRNSYLRVAKEQRWVVLEGVDKHGQQRTREDLRAEIWQHVAKILPRSY